MRLPSDFNLGSNFRNWRKADDRLKSEVTPFPDFRSVRSVTCYASRSAVLPDAAGYFRIAAIVAHSQLNPPAIWRIEFTKAFAGAVNVIHLLSPEVLAILSEADEPMTIHQIVDVIRRQMGTPAKKYNRAAEEQNLRTVMKYLLAEGKVYAIILSGKGQARAYALRDKSPDDGS